MWKHTVSKESKYDIYRAIILGRLLYALQAMWLTKVALRKRDGHARCLRKIMEIQPIVVESPTTPFSSAWVSLT